MRELDGLLQLVKGVTRTAGQRLLDGVRRDQTRYVHSHDNPKEVKAFADAILEEEILTALLPSGLAILSEESGYMPSHRASTYRFIVDPLDGTFNFVKGLGPCAVSIALWDDRRPVFGAVYSLVDRQLAWGGGSLGAYLEEEPITTSDTTDVRLASLCTGFPVRFDVSREDAMRVFWRTVTPYGKVRMLGSADIMLWDVAAGLAIVEGAGGRFAMTPASAPWSYDVVAANAPLSSIRSEHDEWANRE
jgi:myo-inositol-1(or 4)-monophosphatase